jgi:hypothetical protein
MDSYIGFERFVQSTFSNQVPLRVNNYIFQEKKGISMVIISYSDYMYTINIGQKDHKFNICLQLQYI